MDLSGVVLAAQVLLTIVGLGFTAFSIFRSGGFDLTSRARLLQSLRRHSTQFERFYALARGETIQSKSKAVWVFRQAVVGAGLLLLLSILPFFVYIFPFVTWLGVALIAGVSLVALDVASVLFTVRTRRLRDLSTSPDTASWTLAVRATAFGLWVLDGQERTTYVTVFATTVGAFFGLLLPGTSDQDLIYTFYIGAIDASLLVLLVVMTAYHNGVIARLFTEWRTTPSSRDVLVSPFYASGGRVVDRGRLWAIGDHCEVKGPAGEVYVMTWRKVDLLAGEEV